MKKMLLSSLLIVLISSSVFAVGAGVGIRGMGMGGTGIATASDITSAYFNPAGLMYGSENFEFQTFAGGAAQGIADLADAMSKTSFITDNFDQSINTNANLNGGFGLSMKKVGLSMIAIGNANFKKPANSLTFNLNADVNAAVPLTLGSTFSTPGLPIASMSVGVNLKAIAIASGNTIVKQSGITGEGSMAVTEGSGFGFDVGVQARVTPLIMVGAVVRNLSASTSITTKTKHLSVAGTGEVSEGTETEKKESYNPPAEVGVGVGVVIPITGTLIACDLENYSDTVKTYNDMHIGVEQGFLFNLVMLRCGYYTYGPTEDSFYTYGLGLNMGPASLGVAAANSVTDSNNSVASAQLGMAF